jgi:lactoylglutathione lyase
MIGLFVRDLAGMLAFYRDVLGVDIDWDGEGPYAEFLHDGIRSAMVADPEGNLIEIASDFWE